MFRQGSLIFHFKIFVLQSFIMINLSIPVCQGKETSSYPGRAPKMQIFHLEIFVKPLYISLSTPAYQGKKTDSYRGRARYHHHKPHWYDQVQHCQLGPGSSWWYDHSYLTPVWDHNLGLQSLLTMEGKTPVTLMQNQHGLVCSNIPVTYHERFPEKH